METNEQNLEIMDEMNRVSNYIRDIIEEDQKRTNKATMLAQEVDPRFYEAYIEQSHVNLINKNDTYILDTLDSVSTSVKSGYKKIDEYFDRLDNLMEDIRRFEKLTSAYDEEFQMVINHNYYELARLNRACEEVIYYSNQTIKNREEKYFTIYNKLGRFLDQTKELVEKRNKEKDNQVLKPKEEQDQTVEYASSLDTPANKNQEVENLKQMKEQILKEKENNREIESPTMRAFK